MISEAGVLIARISPVFNSQPPRVPGQDKGRIVIAPDFDDPLPLDILDGLAIVGVASRNENRALILVSCDAAFNQYPIQVRWD